MYATWFRALNPRWTLFAGLDLSDSRAANPANGYRQRETAPGGGAPVDGHHRHRVRVVARAATTMRGARC